MQIDYETERELGIDYETLAVKVADKVLEMEKCPYDAQVNLVLTDNEEIERVNTEFRDIARPTDVLSFPMIPFETPAGYDIVEMLLLYLLWCHLHPEYFLFCYPPQTQLP